MSLNLSWDLLVLVFFGTVVAYSFIVGRNRVLKVISASYMGILSADALGNILAKYVFHREVVLKVAKLASIQTPDQAMAAFKVLVLVLIIVLLTVRGSFEFSAEDDRPFSIKTGTNLLFGLLSAGLIISALLIFATGGSLIADVIMIDNPLGEIYAQSRVVRYMVDYKNVWFCLPALAMIFLSFIRRTGEE